MVKDRQLAGYKQHLLNAGLTAAGVALCFLGITSAQAVTLAWDPSPDPEVAGYAVYYGTNSGHYSTRIDVGAQTNACINIPPTGTTYFFAATAYTSDGVESLPSNKVAFAAPPPIGFQMGRTLQSPQTALRFLALAGEQLSVEVSTDQQSWSLLYQLHPTRTGVMEIADPASGDGVPRFYRVTVNNRGTRNAQLVQLPAVPMTTLNLMRPAGTRVQIEVSEDLVYWSPLYSVVSPANHRIEIVDPASATLPKRFYRVRSEN